MSEKEGTASIAQLAIRVGSGVTPTGGSDVYADSGVIFIRSQNVTNSGLLLDDVAFIDNETHQRMSASAVYPFDVLLNITGASIGRCCFVPAGLGPANVNQHVCAIRLAKPNLRDAQFLSAALASHIGQAQIWRLNAGGNREGLNYRQLRSFRVPWPDEQLRLSIAEILATPDETIAQTETFIGKYQQIKLGLVQDLFTRGVTADGRLRPTRAQAPEFYKESAVGWIPKEWDLVRIGESFDIQLGKMLSQLAKTGQSEAPYLGNRNVQWDRVDTSNLDTMDFTDTERQKFKLLPGDLLVCEGGDVGRSAIWLGELETCFYQKAVHRLRPKTLDVLPSFMLRFMRFARDHGYLREFTSRSSIAHLTQEKLAKVRMLKPSRDEQVLIVARFDAIDEVLFCEQDLLSKLRLQKLGLMHDLLTGRVRVKLSKSEEASA